MPTDTTAPDETGRPPRGREAGNGPPRGPDDSSQFTGREPVTREESHRVVIIGCGVGGSIAAFRLAEAGIDNVVLERGRRWSLPKPAGVFPRLSAPDRRLFWFEGGLPSPWAPVVPPALAETIAATGLPRSTGLLNLVPHRDVGFICGAGVGGGSLIHGGVLPQPRPEAFYRIFPSHLDYEELDRIYYPRARRRLTCVPFPDDLLDHPRYRSNRMWHEASVASELDVEPVEANFDFTTIRAELDGAIEPAATVGEYFFTGCNSGAKVSVDRTYLIRAEATGLCDVRPLHNVTSIAQERGGRYRVSAERLTTWGEVSERIMFVSDRVILAAGPHTPPLLLTARETGALPDLNEAVGKRWGTNGDRVTAIRTSPLTAGGPQAGPPASLVRNPDGMAMVVHAPLPLPTETEMLVCVGMGIPDALGEWKYSAATGRAQLDWTAENDAGAAEAVMNLTRRVARHISVEATVTDLSASYLFTAHPLGGAVLGEATDEVGRLHGHAGLYCLDSALMPGSTGAVNPVLTIAAFVERCLDHIIDDFRPV